MTVPHIPSFHRGSDRQVWLWHILIPCECEMAGSHWHMQHWVATIGCLSQSWAFPNIFFNLHFHFKVQYLDRKTKPIGSKLVTPPKWRMISWSRYCTTWTFLFPPLTLVLCDSGRDNTLTSTEMEGSLLKRGQSLSLKWYKVPNAILVEPPWGPSDWATGTGGFHCVLAPAEFQEVGKLDQNHWFPIQNCQKLDDEWGSSISGNRPAAKKGQWNSQKFNRTFLGEITFSRDEPDQHRARRWEQQGIRRYSDIPRFFSAMYQGSRQGSQRQVWRICAVSA